MTLSLPSVSSPLRDPSKVVFATYYGFHLNRGWVGSIAMDAVPNFHLQDLIFNKLEEKLKKLPLSKEFAKDMTQALGSIVTRIPYWLFFNRAMDISASFSRLESALAPTRVTPFAKGWFPSPKRPFFLIATALFALNAIKFFKERANEPKWIPTTTRRLPVKNQTDDFLAVVWRATPYLMIITNIAVTVLQIYQGHHDRLIKLAVTGVTLLPITNLVPQSFSAYLDKCGIPIDLAAFWYGDRYMRGSIIVSWIFRGAL